MTVDTRVYKVLHYLAVVGFAWWAVHYIPKQPIRERLFDAVGSLIFLLLYLLGPAIFGARIRAADDGLGVEQYRRTIIPYSEIQGCHSFYLFPWQLVIVTTKRRFPLNILILAARGAIDFQMLSS